MRNLKIYLGNENQQIIKKAIKLVTSADVPLDDDENAKKESLLSLLYFVSNEYHEAKIHSEKSIDIARSLDIKRTLPAFVFATSSL